MTPAEFQALRKKHAPEDGDLTNPCEFCWPTAYPCDVIKVLDALEEANFQAAINYERGYDDGFKVLDATENLKFSDLKVKVECDHWVTVKKSGQYGYASSVSPEYWTHTYCPKCGEKL